MSTDDTYRTRTTEIGYLGELGDLISQLLDEQTKTNRLLQSIHGQQKVTQDEIQGTIASYGCNH